MSHSHWFACLLAVCLSCYSQAQDTATAQRLDGLGVKIMTARGATSVQVSDCSKLAEADFKAIGSLPKVTNLSLGLGFHEASLPLLAGLTDIETFSSNGMQFTDDGLKAFAQFPKLKRIAFFHPPKNFTGSGLVHFASLKQLEDVSIGGCLAGDEALVSLSKIKTLTRLRIWHDGNTNEGVKHLKELPLESLMLGQRLSYSPPSCPNDETIAILLDIKTLKSLTLSESRFGYESLIRLKQLPKLTQLTLDSVDISDADFERLKSDLPHVRLTLTKPSEVHQKRINALFGKK